MRRAAGAGWRMAAGALVLLWSAFPLYWAFATSLKTGEALFDTALFPAAPRIGNYLAVFADQDFARSVANSFFAAGTAVLVSLVIALPAARAFARVPFRGRTLLLLAVLAVSMFPQIAVLGGLFEMLRAAGLYDSLAGLALVYVLLVLPFVAWSLTAFARAIPPEVEEAARVDGIGAVRYLLRVHLPLIGSAAAAVSLIAFIVAWNEFLFALTFTLTAETRTVPVAISLISGSSQHELPWGRIMAASVIVTAPMVLLAAFFQRRIMAGLAAGASRG